jgi:2-methylcitrate dehydratase PrpD
VKPYPSCALTHSAIDALVGLRDRHGFTPAQVAAIEVGVHRVVPDVLRHDRPTSPLERKFSMPYCAAAAVAHGSVTLRDFEDGPADPAVDALIPRVTMVVDPSLPDTLERQAWTRVTVTLADGRVLAGAPTGASGHPDRPLSAEALREKFLACASTALSRDEAEGIAEQIDRLEDIPDIRVLTSRLVGVVE